MIEIRWVMLLTVALTGGVMAVLPDLSPRDIFFGVRTGREFRASGPGRAMLRWYRIWVAASAAAGMVAVLAAGNSEAALIGAVAGSQVAALGAYFRNYFRCKPCALEAASAREAGLETEDGGLAVWAALATPPFILPVAAMLYLRNHWNQIPLRYAVHFGANGQPNRWVERSQRAVYAPLWFAEGLMVLMLLLGAAVVLGSRKSARQMGMPQMFVAVMYLLSLLFCSIGLSPVVHIPPAALAVAIPIFVVGVLTFAYHKASMTDAAVEDTPDQYWTLGGIYNNPDDPALFVQKRIGYGFTVNFGNRWSWMVMGGFFAGVATLTAYLIWAQR